MQKYLVSFTVPADGHGLRVYSHVLDRPPEPWDSQQITDLRASLAREYALDKIILMGWEPLSPPHGEEECKVAHGYLLMYWYREGLHFGFGHMEIEGTDPISDLDSVRSAEEHVRSFFRFTEVRLISCKKLADLPPEVLEEMLLEEQGAN